MKDCLLDRLLRRPRTGLVAQRESYTQKLLFLCLLEEALLAAT